MTRTIRRHVSRSVKKLLSTLARSQIKDITSKTRPNSRSQRSDLSLSYVATAPLHSNSRFHLPLKAYIQSSRLNILSQLYQIHTNEQNPSQARYIFMGKNVISSRTLSEKKCARAHLENGNSGIMSNSWAIILQHRNLHLHYGSKSP